MTNIESIILKIDYLKQKYNIINNNNKINNLDNILNQINKIDYKISDTSKSTKNETLIDKMIDLLSYNNDSNIDIIMNKIILELPSYNHEYKNDIITKIKKLLLNHIFNYNTTSKLTNFIDYINKL